MAIAAILAALFAWIALRHAPRMPGWRIIALAVLFAAPVVGIVGQLVAGNRAAQTRFDVRFVGYLVPWSALSDCAAAPDLWADRGVWFGGGIRWEDDSKPDVIVYPGYRSHLVEVCADRGSSGALRVRVVEPGMEFGDGASASRRLLSASRGLITQRVVLDPIGDRLSPTPDRDAIAGARADTERWNSTHCLVNPSTTSVPSGTLERLVTRAWNTGQRQANLSWRSRLMNLIRTAPPAARTAVFCVDTNQPDQRCLEDLPDARTATFLWRPAGGLATDMGLGRWDGLPAVGATSVACGATPSGTTNLDVIVSPSPISGLLGQSTWGAMPGVSLSMVARRSAGNAADASVPIPAGSASPAPFQLGPKREVRFGTRDGQLVMLVEQPSVQLRGADLFGSELAGVPEGEFEIAFGRPSESRLPVIDLTSQADQQNPKPALGDLRLRVGLAAMDAGRFTIYAPGVEPAVHLFGDVVAFAASSSGDSQPAQPLFVVSRVGVPAAVWIIPLVAALLLAFGAITEPNRLWGRTGSMPLWFALGLVVILLDFQFLMTTRRLLDAPGSASNVGFWLRAGAYPLLLPVILMAFAVFSVRWAKVTADWARHRPPAVAQEVGVAARVRLWAAFAADRLLARPWFPWPFNWLVMASAATLAWTLVAHPVAWKERFVGDAGGTFRDVWIVGFVASVSALFATKAYKWFVAFARDADRAVDAGWPSPAVRQRAFRWLRPALAAAIGGAALGLVRVLLMLFRFQESMIGGIKLDVFYLPLTAALLASLTDATHERPAAMRILAILIFWMIAFGIVGWVVNDLGLLWVGATALILVLPKTIHVDGPIQERPRQHLVVFAVWAALLGLLFVAPLKAPVAVRTFVQWYASGSNDIAGPQGLIQIADPLQVNMKRDAYRMLDAVIPEEAANIPSLLAKEVVLERERVRYQATDGAWRVGYREREVSRAPWLGAGLLEARPIVGEETFLRAARWDYVLPVYLRAEFGALGVLGVLLVYLVLWLTVAPSRRSGSRGETLATWGLGIGVGSALFMIGGTHGIFPFSGKWPMLLAIASRSDVALAAALLVMAFSNVLRQEQVE